MYMTSVFQGVLRDRNGLKFF